jgi:oxygen-independent coproporphyrinogen III oxidase
VPSADAPQITIDGRQLEAPSAPITAIDLFQGGLPTGSQKAVFGGWRGSTRLGLYIHVPFCFHKCHYCDFYSIVDSRDRRGKFTARLIDEIRASRRILDTEAPKRLISTVFVGGGTPTLLEPVMWEAILTTLAECDVEPGAECTVEANPETVSSELAAVLIGGGVNRISIGAQSFNHAHLKTLERWHDPANVGLAMDIFRSAGAAGVRSINLDLIFAIPGQSVEDWEADLDAAISLKPDHLSCYNLMYEPNTALTKKVAAGRVEPLSDDVAAEMYELTCDRLAGAGFEHYEISAWAREGHRCVHNLLYWTNQDWWPLGPSASGHVDGTRWKSVPKLGEYLATGPMPPITEVSRLDEDGRIGEELMLRLRLVEGIERERLDALVARGHRGPQRAAAVQRAMSAGLLEENDDRVRFTRRGLLLADTVIADIL